MTILATTQIQYGCGDVFPLKDELKITSNNLSLLFSNNHYVEVDITYNALPLISIPSPSAPTIQDLRTRPSFRAATVKIALGKPCKR